VSDRGRFRKPSSRPVTDEEGALIRWLLDHGEEGSDRFIPQIGTLSVASVCACGCPTITFALDEGGKRKTSRLISDYLGVVEGQQVGVMLFATESKLSMLEVYSLAGTDKPFRLPEIQSLFPWREFRNHPIPPR
jgi:hypothetical protein